MASSNNIFKNTGRPHYYLQASGEITKYEREKKQTLDTNWQHLQRNPLLLQEEASTPLEDNRLDGTTVSSNLLFSDSVYARLAPAEPQSISFNGPDGQAILKLDPNGDIYVNGRLADNDREVVQGMYQLLGQHNLI